MKSNLKSCSTSLINLNSNSLTLLNLLKLSMNPAGVKESQIVNYNSLLGVLIISINEVNKLVD